MKLSLFFDLFTKKYQDASPFEGFTHPIVRPYEYIVLIKFAHEFSLIKKLKIKIKTYFF